MMFMSGSRQTLSVFQSVQHGCYDQVRAVISPTVFVRLHRMSQEKIMRQITYINAGINSVLMRMEPSSVR